MPFGLKLGMPNTGGPLILENGLVFIAAALGSSLPCFGSDSGGELWRAPLPPGGKAIRMPYKLKGVKYIVMAAGGHGNMGSNRSDHIVAFALTD